MRLIFLIIIILSASCSEEKVETESTELITESKFISCTCKDTSKPHPLIGECNSNKSSAIFEVNESTNTFGWILGSKEFEIFEISSEKTPKFFMDFEKELILSKGEYSLLEESTRFDEYEIIKSMTFENINNGDIEGFSFLLERLRLSLEFRMIYEPKRQNSVDIIDDLTEPFFFKCNLVDKI